MTMANADGWIVTRQRVSLAGRVIAAGGRNAAGGAVSLTAVRGSRRGRAAALESVAPQYEARIHDDGFYFFLDLPAGDYVLAGRDERGNDVEARAVSIPSVDNQGRGQVVSADLTAAAPNSGSDEKQAKTRASSASGKRRRGSRSGMGNDARA